MSLGQDVRGAATHLFGDILSGGVRRVHFIGIGGMALSGIARILLERGYEVTGSDISSTTYTARLSELGAKVSIGHDPANVEGAGAVIFSAAIKPDNPELIEAARLDTPIVRRAEIIGRLMDQRTGIAVAGTHGKTTTSAMISLILVRSGLSPGYLIGASSRDLGGNAQWSDGEHFVVEADEYDSAFLEYSPHIALINYLEPDHLDYFGSIKNMVEKFCDFARNVRPGGSLFIRNMGPLVKYAAAASSQPVVWLGEGGHWVLDKFEPDAWGSRFRIIGPSGDRIDVKLSVPGLHNAYNALAALAVSSELGVEVEASAGALLEFLGVDRRFQLLAEGRGISVVEEYSHHPTEIRASIEAARQIHTGRLWVIFQPHLRSRTEDFFQDFANAFDQADRVTITEIFSPEGRESDAGISGKDLADAIGRDTTSFQLDFEAGFTEVEGSAEAGDMILVMGAGDVNSLSDRIAEWVRR